MKIIKENINKISLRELGLGDDFDIRIWEALLPGRYGNTSMACPVFLTVQKPVTLCLNRP